MIRLNKPLHSLSSPVHSKDHLHLKEIDAIGQIKAYETAHNAYAVDMALAFFVDHAVLEFSGLGNFQNHEAIRQIHEYDKAIHAQINAQNFVVDGERVICAVREQNDWLTAAGLEDIFYPSVVYTFTTEGKIQKISATISVKDGAAIEAVLAEFVPWLMKQRPLEAKRLFTKAGEFVYSGTNGSLVIALLAHWQSKR
jgi:hypothetical protein